MVNVILYEKEEDTKEKEGSFVWSQNEFHIDHIYDLPSLFFCNLKKNIPNTAFLHCVEFQTIKARWNCVTKQVV